MAKKKTKILSEILALPRETLSRVALSHVVLLGVTLLGGLPYLIMQAVLAVELLLLSLATIPLYPERGVGKHVFAIVKLIFTLIFVYFFVMVTYGVASGGGEGDALSIASQSLADAGIKDLLLSLLYVALSLTISLRQAMRDSNPRKAWAIARLIHGAVTTLAMIFMTFVSVFLGAPIGIALNNFGFPVDVNVILITLMVITRLFFALVAATIPENEMSTLAASPYMD